MLILIIAFIIWKTTKRRKVSAAPSDSGDPSINIGSDENDGRNIGDIHELFKLSDVAQKITEKEA